MAAFAFQVGCQAAAACIMTRGNRRRHFALWVIISFALAVLLWSVSQIDDPDITNPELPDFAPIAEEQGAN